MSDRCLVFASAALIMLVMSPLIHVLAGLLLWLLVSAEAREPLLLGALMVGVASPLLAALVVAGVTFRQGDTPLAAGVLLGASVSTSAASVFLWYVLRNLRVGF